MTLWLVTLTDQPQMWTKKQKKYCERERRMTLVWHCGWPMSQCHQPQCHQSAIREKTESEERKKNRESEERKSSTLLLFKSCFRSVVSIYHTLLWGSISSLTLVSFLLLFFFPDLNCFSILILLHLHAVIYNWILFCYVFRNLYKHSFGNSFLFQLKFGNVVNGIIWENTI